MQAFGYAYAMRLLTLAEQQGILQVGSVKHVCDFGTGTGGPALALQQFFQLPASRLTLLEEYSPQAVLLRRLFPKGKICLTNGLSWLEANANQQFDLISAFMLGPDYEGDGLVVRFLEQALSCLSPAGALLICSDTATMQVVQNVLRDKPELNCYWLLDESPMSHDDVSIPITVIVRPAKTSTMPMQNRTVELPRPVFKSAMIPDAQGEWAMERYCISTQFERAYFQATIDTFEHIQPNHPAIEPMRRILSDVS